MRRVPAFVWLVGGIIVAVIVLLLWVRVNRNTPPTTQQTQLMSDQFATPTSGFNETTVTPAEIGQAPPTVSLISVDDFDRTIPWVEIPKPGKGAVTCGRVTFEDPGTGYGFVTISVDGQPVGKLTFSNPRRSLSTGTYHLGSSSIAGGPNNIVGVKIGDTIFVVTRDIVVSASWRMLPATGCVVVAP